MQWIYIIAIEQKYFLYRKRLKRTYSHIERKETKNITHFLLIKAHPISVIRVALHYEQICRVPTFASDGIFL